jgi:hypothetical protein
LGDFSVPLLRKQMRPGPGEITISGCRANE